MRKFLPILIIIVAVAGSASTGWWLYKKYYPSSRSKVGVQVSKQDAVKLANLDSASLIGIASVEAQKEQLDALNKSSETDRQTLISIVKSPL